MAQYKLRFTTKDKRIDVSLTTVPFNQNINFKISFEALLVSFFTLPVNNNINFKMFGNDLVNLLGNLENKEVGITLDRFLQQSLVASPEDRNVGFNIEIVDTAVFVLKSLVEYVNYLNGSNSISIQDNTNAYSALNVTGWGAPNPERDQYNLYLFGERINYLQYNHTTKSYETPTSPVYIENANNLGSDITLWTQEDIANGGTEGLYVFTMIASPTLLPLIGTKENKLRVVTELRQSVIANTLQGYYYENEIIVPVIPSVYKCLNNYFNKKCYDEYYLLLSYINILNIAVKNKQTLTAQKVYQYIKSNLCTSCN